MSGAGALVAGLFALGVVLVMKDGPRRRVIRVPAVGVPWRRLVPWMGLCALGAGLVVLAVTAVPIAAVVVAGFGGAAPILRYRRGLERRRAAARAAWPDAIDALAAGVRAGQGLPDCIADLSRTGPVELRSVFAAGDAELRASGDFAAAMAAMSGMMNESTNALVSTTKAEAITKATATFSRLSPLALVAMPIGRSNWPGSLPCVPQVCARCMQAPHAWL